MVAQAVAAEEVAAVAEGEVGVVMALVAMG